MNSKLQEFIDIYAYDGILHLASANRKETLAKVLATPFDPEVHYVLAYIHLHYAMLDEAKAILDHTTDKDDETYKQLEDYLNALLECRAWDIGIFPLTVRYRNWWNGPHFVFPEEFNGQKMDSWFPIRLDYIEGDHAYLTAAKKEGEEVTYGCQIEIPSIEIGAEPESMGEIAFYGDSYMLQFHSNGPWIQDPELNAVREKAWPHITKSSERLREEIEKDLARITD